MKVLTIPFVGSIVSWYGTLHKVIGVEWSKNGMWATVRVKLGNGIEVHLWWYKTEGCKIIS